MYSVCVGVDSEILRGGDPRRLDILGETGCAESVPVWNVDPRAPGVRLEQDPSEPLPSSRVTTNMFKQINPVTLLHIKSEREGDFLFINN